MTPTDADATLTELSDLCARARTALAASSGGETAAGRVQTATRRPEGGFRIDVASDGLALGDKVELERLLRAALPDEAALGLTVYFRKAGAPAPTGPAGPAPLPSRKSPFGLTIERRAIPGVTEILVVASGKGGVGKSTVSVNLAVALVGLGARVGLLDADIYGPSAPLMMGVQGVRPQAAGDKLVPVEAHGVKIASFGFLTDVQEPVIWRGPLIAKAFKQLAYDVAWGELDYLVIDLPPGTGDVQLALIESLPIHGALIVTTPQDVALLDAHKALSMFERLDVRVLGLVENMAHFHCPKCGHDEPIFGAGGASRMGAERRLPVLAEVPLALGVRARGDAGRPIALDEHGVEAEIFRSLAERVRSRR